jgi:NADPH:quinone reductase-like Zn-dependent oxidoreductase
MLFEYANLSAGELCLVHGAAGNVGAYAVQLAHQKGIRDAAYLRDLGADQVIDYRTTRFDDVVKNVDALIDLAGGETADRSYGVLRPGGVLVSAVVFEPSQEKARQYRVRAVFMLVDVTTERWRRSPHGWHCGTASAPRAQQEVMDAPNQGEPATRAGGWHYLLPLDVSQSKGSTAARHRQHRRQNVGSVVDTAGTNATVGAMPAVTTAANFHGASR